MEITGIKLYDNKIIIGTDCVEMVIGTDSVLRVKTKLSTLKPKEEFKIGEEVFIVLEQSDDGTKVISKDFVYSSKTFGDCSDWEKSPIRALLNNDYYNKIVKLVGASNIISMERDLTSLDGLDDYGTCDDKISLLSASEYAKYHKILGSNFDYSDGWWTITPFSTPSNEYSHYVCGIGSSGSVGWVDCGCHISVRPFLKLDSSVFVSLNKD